MFLKINGYRLQKDPLQPDAVSQNLAEAQVAICTNAWTVEELGRFYERMATVIEAWTPDIIVYRNQAPEY